MNCNRLLITGILTLGILAPSDGRELNPDLQPAFAKLREGRFYQHNFPPKLVNGVMQGKTQRQVRDDYLGFTGPSRFEPLMTAIDGAVAFRNSQSGFSYDNADAQELAWEALGSLLQGQLISGNANLLRGLRIAFPNDGPEKPGGEIMLPFGSPQPLTAAERVVTTGEYPGANIADLCYARAHFLRGITAALQFMSDDSSGELLVRDPSRPLPQYTRFNDAGLNPTLVDPNFSGPVDIQTSGYLLGNLVDRYGKAVIGIGDHLWRAAYFDRQRAPGQPRAQQRSQMLDAATRELQKGAHAQFLASLPLAATFDEGEEGYALCRVDQVRISAMSANTFIDRIRRGEVPKLDTVSLAASTNQVKIQLAVTRQAQTTARDSYNDAQQAIWKVKDQEATVAAQATSIRTQFKTSLLAAVALDPDGVNLDGTVSYAGLETVPGRTAFRADVRSRMFDLLEAGSSSSSLTDSGELGQTILQINRAFAEIRSSRNRIDSVPQQIRIEEERVGAINGVMVGTTDQITSYQLSMGIANSIVVTAGVGTITGPFCGVTVNPGALVSALFQNKITRAQTLQNIEINDINAAAAIRNLLLQQHQYTIDLEQSILNGQLAIANLNSLLARVDRLIEDRVYYKEVNDGLWYSDPALVFEREDAEIKYENALNNYKRQLYYLAQSMASRWCEPFSNPVKIGESLLQPLDNPDFDYFTQPESVFNIYRSSEGDLFLAALGNWEQKLNQFRTGGQRVLETAIISLRKDIFGFSDVTFDPERSEFRVDPSSEVRDRQLKLFRAMLLKSVQPADSGFWLRLQFPLTWGQSSRSTVIPGSIQPAVVKANAADWNLRITSASARVIGSRVAPANTSLPVQLYQYGKVELPQYYPRTIKQRPEFSTFNLPLYYDDPQILVNSPFKLTFSAGLNGASGPGNIEDNVELSPFCDRYVLLIPRGGDVPLLNVQNISDIEITFQVASGKPPILLLQ